MPIDSRILITPSERLSDGDRALVLNCRTERAYQCSNYRIAFAVARGASTVRVNFGQIDLVGMVCFAAIGPATCAIDLGDLSPGRYSVVFNSTFGDTRVDLLVEEGAYIFSVDEGQGVSISPATLRRS